MPRRVNLPGASELFRPTADSPAPVPTSTPDAPVQPDAAASASAPGQTATTTADAPAPAASGMVQPTGRIKHDEKITVYVSSEELLALEQLRLTLRAQHGVAVDRGRIVRAAIAEALADVHDRGADAALLKRLTA